MNQAVLASIEHRNEGKTRDDTPPKHEVAEALAHKDGGTHDGNERKLCSAVVVVAAAAAACQQQHNHTSCSSSSSSSSSGISTA